MERGWKKTNRYENSSFGLWKLWKYKRKWRWSQSSQVPNPDSIILLYLEEWYIKKSSSFWLEKLSSYPDGPELPVIGFDSLMNFTHPHNLSPFESNKQFFKESLVQSEIKEFWPTHHGYNSWFLLSQSVIRIRFTLYLYGVYQNQAAKDKIKITFCRIVWFNLCIHASSRLLPEVQDFFLGHWLG